MRFLKSFEPLGLLVLRCVVGLIFLFHGYPKLVHPTPAMHDFFASHGLPAEEHMSSLMESFDTLRKHFGDDQEAAGIIDRETR